MRIDPGKLPFLRLTRELRQRMLDILPSIATIAFFVCGVLAGVLVMLDSP